MKMGKLLSLLFLCLLPSLCAAGKMHVLLVPSGNAEPYRVFSDAFRQSLPADIQVDELKLENFTGRESADLVVTIGMRAASFVVKKASMPVIAAMLPSYDYAALKLVRPVGLSGIFVDQPWTRQVSLLRAAFPERKLVGVLASPDAGLDIDKLRMQLRGAGESLVSEAVPRGTLFEKLEKVLSSSQVLLAVPDIAIYNSNTIRDIMLSSYRHRVPVVGFSQAFVNAGALCAIYSTPDQLAAQAGLMVNAYQRLRVLPNPEYPNLFKISINHEVANMLGIPIGSDELLILKLEREGAAW